MPWYIINRVSLVNVGFQWFIRKYTSSNRRDFSIANMFLGVNVTDSLGILSFFILYIF